MNIKTELIKNINSAIDSAFADYPLGCRPEIMCEPPKHRNQGNLSTNAAMQIAKLNKGLNPIIMAERLRKEIMSCLEKSPIADSISKIEVKKPGFINFFFSKQYLRSAVNEITSQGYNFGRPDSQKANPALKVLIEFVSANPTGPLSVAHGRQAAIGDVLANIMEFSGHTVKKEYYLNDDGNQILLLGRSIHARYCELLGEECPFPENGYKGSYIYDIAKKVIDKHNSDLTLPDEKNIKFFSDFGIKTIMENIKQDLKDFGVKFDSYYSQRKLGLSGDIEKALDELREKRFLYEKDGALWFESTCFGDDKDRVVRKSDGSYTYIAPDIAYHKDKYERGFDTLIDLLGPDHHGYISRMKAACQAIGKDAQALSMLIVQLVTISRNGVPVRMSTREGEFISLREVMDEVGNDVARFFFLTRRMDSHLDFDLELAKKESMENPVYYIQYAHARICGILKQAGGKGAYKFTEKDPDLIDTDEEMYILSLLREFPDIMAQCSRNLEPHKLITYLMELAGSFHGFYAKHRVISSDVRITSARLMLIESLRIIFSSALKILGVSVPDTM